MKNLKILKNWKFLKKSKSAWWNLFEFFKKKNNFPKFLHFSKKFDFFWIIQNFWNFQKSWLFVTTELTKCNNIWSYIRYRIPPSVVALKFSYGSVINLFLKFWNCCGCLHHSLFCFGRLCYLRIAAIHMVLLHVWLHMCLKQLHMLLFPHQLLSMKVAQKTSDTKLIVEY